MPIQKQGLALHWGCLVNEASRCIYFLLYLRKCCLSNTSAGTSLAALGSGGFSKKWISVNQGSTGLCDLHWQRFGFGTGAGAAGSRSQLPAGRAGAPCRVCGGVCGEAWQGLTPKPHAPFDGVGPTSPNLKRHPGLRVRPVRPEQPRTPRGQQQSPGALTERGGPGSGIGVPLSESRKRGGGGGGTKNPSSCKNALRSFLVLVLLPARMRAGNRLPLSIPGIDPAAQLPRAELGLAGQRLRQSPVSKSGSDSVGGPGTPRAARLPPRVPCWAALPAPSRRLPAGTGHGATEARGSRASAETCSPSPCLCRGEGTAIRGCETS